uniref:Uncharacterized protein n=1 Tax=Timema shepardi TaxID=629360 RepID=A0A7R9G0N4_TIMSH|nr:unnamed protein product [Timema shepardi]
MIKLKQNSALLDVIVHTKKIFHRSLSDFRVICTRLPPPDLTFPIAKRYSHSACVHGAYNLVWSDELHQGIGIRAVEFELWPRDLTHYSRSRLECRKLRD